MVDELLDTVSLLLTTSDSCVTTDCIHLFVDKNSVYDTKRSNLIITEELSVCVLNGLLNHAVQSDQTSHERVINPGKVTVNNLKFLVDDWKSNSEKFLNNLKEPTSDTIFKLY